MSEPTRKERPEPTVAELERGLLIDEHSLENACRAQSQMLYKVGKALAIAESQRDAAYKEIKEVEARVDGQLRAEYGDERPRETEVECRKLLHRDVLAIKERHLKLKRRASEIEALMEAYRDRKFMLQKLVDLYLANYYGSEIDGTHSRMRSAQAERARSARTIARGQR